MGDNAYRRRKEVGMNKYGAKKITVDGITFDSKKEANRYCELRLLEKAGYIENLQRQVRYTLIPKQEGERACEYVADFVYIENGKTVVEDVKSKATRTDAYIIKRKLMKYNFGITIKEV